VAHLAVPGGFGDAAHRPGQPPVLPFQRQRQVGPVAVVGLPPPGGDGAQLPQGLLVPVPAVGQLVAAAVDPAGDEDSGDPFAEGGQLAGAGSLIEIVPAGRSGAAGGGRVEGVVHLPGQLLKLSVQVGEGLATGLPVAAFQRADLAAQVAQLVAERGYCPSKRFDVRRGRLAHSSGPPAGMIGKGMVSWIAAWPLPLPLAAAVTSSGIWTWALMGCRTGRAGARPSR
jgi:hypothetical protein